MAPEDMAPEEGIGPRNGEVESLVVFTLSHIWRRKAPALLRVPGPEQRHTALRCRGIMSRVIRSLIEWNSVGQSYRTQHCVQKKNIVCERKCPGCHKDKPRC